MATKMAKNKYPEFCMQVLVLLDLMQEMKNECNGDCVELSKFLQKNKLTYMDFLHLWQSLKNIQDCIL